MALSIENKRGEALGGWPMIIAWAAMMIFAIHACTHMVAAGDTWVAMASGRHFINHGVNTVEPFSANSHKAGPTWEEIATWPDWAQWIAGKVGLEAVRYWHPTGWINQNWLTHVIFYWLTTLSPFADAKFLSFNTLVYWKFAIYIMAAACVYCNSRVLGVNPALSAVFACFSMFIGRTFLDIRPAGFSNLLVAVFLLILALSTYRNVLYIWLIVPLAVFWCNVHGGYIYLFIMLVPFIILNLIVSPFKNGFITIGLRGVKHSIAAGAVAFLAMVVFNPFHLTNLTHTFIISVSKHAEYWRTVNEWHPAFEWDNPVGDEIPFLIMYIIAWVVFVAWIVSMSVVSPIVKERMPKKKSAVSSGEYQKPRVNLAMMVIASLTIYMAIRSRRFIPIAGIVACPFIAMLMDETVRAIAATVSFRKGRGFLVPAMNKWLQIFFAVAGTAAALFFGIWWGLKFKCVYLDPWPNEPKLNSVFMRMSASDVKPFYACEFIRANKLQGKMFNYWTEGGFIAWGQIPDPNTGRTPLQLFIDGRAQAAYEPEIYGMWADIMAGGPIMRDAAARRRQLSAEDYVKAGQWIGNELKKHDVWVVMMPVDQFDSPLVRGLEYNPNWPIVYMDNFQKLFVDVTRLQGKELFDGIFSGKTVYPDKFSENLVKAHNIFLFGKEKAAQEMGLDYAIKAFEAYPSQLPLRRIVMAADVPELAPRINEFFSKYLYDFMQNKNQYVKQNGYFHRIGSAYVTCSYLQEVAKKNNNAKFAEFYGAKRQEYMEEQRKINRSKRW